MPPGNQPNKFLINSFCVFIGVVLITLCFVLLSVAYNQIKLCSDNENCNGAIETKAKVFRIVAAVVFMVGFALITMFWWKLKSLRALNNYHGRFIGLQQMEMELAELGIAHEKSMDFGVLGERNYA